MSIEDITQLNPERKFYEVPSPAFQEFGRVLSDSAQTWIDEALLAHPIPEGKASYQPDIQDLHDNEIIAGIKTDVFGEMDIQVGLVAGYNETLTGIEFHQGSEVNIACTDCILLLGRKSDMQGTSYDASLTQAFYLKKGTVIEIYSTTLHYTPIQADANGFSLGVILLAGTNTEINAKAGSMLTKKNKWYITHASQTEKIKAGCIAGLTGELVHIKHPQSKTESE